MTPPRSTAFVDAIHSITCVHKQLLKDPCKKCSSTGSDFKRWVDACDRVDDLKTRGISARNALIEQRALELRLRQLMANQANLSD